MSFKNSGFKVCVIVIALAILLIGATGGFRFGLSVSDNKANYTDEKIDYSEYSFTDTIWTRSAEHDIETIIFSSDGSFTYYCACGNPVNDSDLNEGYTYDDETKTITIKYIETTEETVSTIKIEACDDKSIKLNFDGEIREFVIGLS